MYLRLCIQCSGGYMQVNLSTLTEVDYTQTLEKIEQSYTENPKKGKAKRALVARLRQSPSYQYELEVIAKDEAAVVVGHVMLSKINIVAQDAKYPALELASLSVDPEVRAQGIGKALVNAVEERARAENFNTIIVSGAPDYFEQLGYEKAEIYDIYSDESTLEQLQVKFLWDQLTDYPHGKVKDADVV